MTETHLNATRFFSFNFLISNEKTIFATKQRRTYEVNREDNREQCRQGLSTLSFVDINLKHACQTSTNWKPRRTSVLYSDWSKGLSRRQHENLSLKIIFAGQVVLHLFWASSPQLVKVCAGYLCKFSFYFLKFSSFRLRLDRFWVLSRMSSGEFNVSWWKGLSLI